MTTPSRFWDRRAAEYAKKPVPDERAYAQTLERVRAYLTPNDRVLELGCGTGSTALALSASTPDILATDYSAEMIAIATAKARAAGVTSVRFRQSDTEDLALGEEPFDVVLAMNLLHLVGDVPALARRVHGLLRPGGLFVSKTPCLGDQGLAVRWVVPLLRVFRAAPYVNFATERSLVTDVTGGGFEIVETGMYPRKSRSFFVVARRT